MSALVIHDRDTFAWLTLVVREDTGLPMNLTGAAVLALAGRPGAPGVAATVSVLSPGSSEIACVFAPSALSPAP